MAENITYGTKIAWVGCDVEINGIMEHIDDFAFGKDPTDAITLMKEALTDAVEELTEQHCTNHHMEGEYRFAVDVDKKMVMIGKADLRGSDGWLVLKIGKFKIEEV